MRARVGRHFRKSKAIRWHIDHLTHQAGMLQAVLIEGGVECDIVICGWPLRCKGYVWPAPSTRWFRML
ncbi:hypothetical protein [Sphingopyxis sp. DBS4]|uniref:hypothetical protein n=1 Tax=Sphingopyxis sp. DBS4 TaxID=2968500 RepID=UPI0035A616FB